MLVRVWTSVSPTTLLETPCSPEVQDEWRFALSVVLINSNRIYRRTERVRDSRSATLGTNDRRGSADDVDDADYVQSSCTKLQCCIEGTA
jgi:hypothetical protein